MQLTFLNPIDFNLSQLEIRTMVKSHLLSTLLYGCEISDNCDYYDKCKLNLLYNNITRYIFNLKKFDHRKCILY